MKDRKSITPFGLWLLKQWSLDITRNPWGRNDHDLIVRGNAWFIRFDFTRMTSKRNPTWARLKVSGYTLYEKNHEYSGLPGARGFDHAANDICRRYVRLQEASGGNDEGLQVMIDQFRKNYPRECGIWTGKTYP